MTRAEKAVVLRNEHKYNCAQAVAAVFAEDLHADSQLLFKTCEGFGSGMGNMEGTCGALVGAIMAAGLKNSDGDLENPCTKASTYQFSRELMKSFQAQNGATICKDLKGIETGNMLASCPECISRAVTIAEEILGL